MTAMQDFSTEQLTKIVYMLIILSLLVYGYVRSNSGKALSEHLLGWLIWIAIFIVIIIGYAFRHELDEVKRRVISVLVPSYAWVEDGEITLSRNADGHFYINTLANNKTTIKFLIDTGATGVAITQKDAINMGIDISKLQYTRASNTANGISYSAPIKIKTLQIGKKVLHNVEAHVSSGGLDISLLGMAVLDDFKDFRFVNDNLILKY
jgi:aspartyl protease family protein